MGIRRYNPTTPGRRGATVSDFAELTPGAKRVKSLLVRKRKKGGRNNQGVITSRHRGGGHKQQYRLIDFRRTKDGIPANVHSIQYDPNRSARIALLHYADGEKRYILAPEGLKAGDQLMSGPDAPAAVGNCLPLTNIPLGMDIHNIEMQPGRGGALCRSAGNKAIAGRSRCRLGANQLALRRNSPRARHLPRDHRHGQQFGTHGHRVGQSRPQALDGPAAARPRHGDESDRPSARRW